MVEIHCAGERLRLLSEKAVHWPATHSLIIADLHLGKSAAFRMAGIGVPETTTTADLDRLKTLIANTGCRRLIILGDLLHGPAGMQTAMTAYVQEWRGRHEHLEIILVAGNHDRKSGPPPDGWNMRCVEGAWKSGPFLFVHEPVQHPSAYVMAGHIHPALVLREKFGPGIRAACFCFGRKRAILPAFGSFTGMSNLEPLPGDRIFPIGSDEVIEVK